MSLFSSTIHVLSSMATSAPSEAAASVAISVGTVGLAVTVTLTSAVLAELAFAVARTRTTESAGCVSPMVSRPASLTEVP